MAASYAGKSLHDIIKNKRKKETSDKLFVASGT
jgi:hypothetical protein